MSEWERRLVWAPEAGQVHDTKIPDIILSVGAGVQARALQASADPRRASKLLPGGVRGRVNTLKQMFKATLDCEIVYNDFSRFFDGQAELRSRCHRLNIVLPDKPCELDEVDKLEELEDTALDFLSPRCRQAYDPNFENAYSHIQHVASKLRASLFYFDVTEIQPNDATNPRDWQVDGLLRCRLKRQYHRRLHSLLKGGNLGPLRFRARTTTGIVTNWSFPINNWDFGKFSVAASMRIIDRRNSIFVEMKFDKSGHWEVISGFPRVLEVISLDK